MIRTTLGCRTPSTSMFFDGQGADLSQGSQRKLDGSSRGRSTGGRSPERSGGGDLHFPSSVFDSYQVLLRNVDITGIADSGSRSSSTPPTAARGWIVLPSLLGKLGVDSLTINPGLDEARPTESADMRRSGLVRLGEIVASSRAAFGVRFDPVGAAVARRREGPDHRGRPGALVMLDLIAAERRSGRVALPVTTTRIAEQVAAYHGTQVEWTTTLSGRPDPGRRREKGDLRRRRQGRLHRPRVQQASTTARRPSCG